MFPRERTHLLPALHFLQHEFGYLPGWALQIVSWHLRVPASEVYGAATSYTELRLEDPGKHLVRVCAGLSCWHSGGRELLRLISDRLAQAPSDSPQEARTTLEETACGYICAMAPAVEVDGQWYGRVAARDLPDLVGGIA
jgi:NADH:ubiquinone oxidoreductase subunit E